VVCPSVRKHLWPHRWRSCHLPASGQHVRIVLALLCSPLPSPCRSRSCLLLHGTNSVLLASRPFQPLSLHPVLRYMLQECQAWKQPRCQRPPTMSLMSEGLHAHIAAHMALTWFSFITKKAGFFDWMRLAHFTVSGIAAEGCGIRPKQTCNRGHRFTTVPLTSHAGEWAG
jgi:hypothetical protein